MAVIFLSLVLAVLGSNDGHGAGLPEMSDVAAVRTPVARTIAAKEWDNAGEAIAILEEGGKAGMGEAWRALGEVFLLGLKGCKVNHTRAFLAFEEGARLGHPRCQAYLGLMHGAGAGTVSDQPLALLNLVFAAMDRDMVANAALGYRHLHGVGVPASCEAAANYYRIAAKEVFDSVVGDGLEPDYRMNRLTDDVADGSLDDAEEDIVQYYRSSAASGSKSAQVAMGQLLWRGSYGTTVDYDAAMRYFQQAAEAGDGSAMASIGHMYSHGWGVEANNATALSWYRKGAQKESPTGLTGLGYFYLHGTEVAQNVTKAYELFKKASDRGSPDAKYNIGVMLLEGKYIKKNYVKAIQHLSVASHQGHVASVYQLGLMHLAGLGTGKSCNTAAQLFKSVVESGHFAKYVDAAHSAYQLGDYDAALANYQVSAEIGMELGQSNVAFLLDHGLFPTDDDDDDEDEAEDAVDDDAYYWPNEKPTPKALRWLSVALRRYEQSAEQGNVVSRLKLGDYYFYGTHTGGKVVEYRKAAAHYRKAADASSAQALFNLGTMHAAGQGLPQDFHLAKRFYDEAMAASAEASLPATLALAQLAVSYVYHTYLGDFELLGMRWDTILIGVFSAAVVCLLALRPR